MFDAIMRPIHFIIQSDHWLARTLFGACWLVALPLLIGIRVVQLTVLARPLNELADAQSTCRRIRARC